MRSTKKEGPGKIICDTQEKSSRVPLMDPSPEISAISAGAKAIIAFFLRNSRLLGRALADPGGTGGRYRWFWHLRKNISIMLLAGEMPSGCSWSTLTSL